MRLVQREGPVRLGYPIGSRACSIAYLALTKTTDWELPPSVKTLIGVMPAFNEGTVASSVVSLTYLKSVLDDPNDTLWKHSFVPKWLPLMMTLSPGLTVSGVTLTIFGWLDGLQMGAFATMGGGAVGDPA